MTCSIWKQRALDAEAEVRELEALIQRCLSYAPAPYFHDIERDIRAALKRRALAALSRTEAANADLRKALNDDEWEVARFGPQRTAHLAGQPAAPDRPGMPRARFAVGVDGLARAQSAEPAAPSRTEANPLHELWRRQEDEQAVLDADVVAKRVCDLAWHAGWVLEYKLTRRGLK